MSLLDTASLIVTPNGYKEGKLYSVIPSDGSGDMSVTRATTATRVNSAGLVELVPYNLLSWSQDFTNGWFAYLGSITATANYGTAPDGTNTSTRILFTSNNQIWAKAISGLTNVNGTFSVWIKGVTGQTIAISYGGTDNVVTLQSGWNRYSVTAVGTIDFIFIDTFSSTATDIEVWGGQVVEGSVAKDYQKTETRLNIPRLDYSNGTCPSLLVEPQRTNLALYSSSFDNAAWDKINGTMTANATTAPDGNTTAEQWAGDGTNTIHDFYQAFTGGSTTTSSIYVKKNTAQFVYISLNHQGTGTDWATGVYDLDNLTTATFQSGGVTNQVATISDEGNGWRRITLSVSTTDVNLFCMYGIANSLSPSFGANRGRVVFSTSASFYAWGAQLEAGSYPTSYIPTTSASVTRNADVISKTGISSLIGQTEGTLFFDVYAQLNTADEQDLSISDGTGNNRAIIRLTSSGTIRGIGVFGGNLEFNIGGSTYTTGTRYKIALAYKNNDVALYVNGTSQGTSSSTTISGTLSRLGFDVFTNGAQIICSPTNATALWKTRLTNTQLAQLTSI